MLAAPNIKEERIYRILLKVIAHKAVPLHLGRSEAQVRKRRPKAYSLMTNFRPNKEEQLQ